MKIVIDIDGTLCTLKKDSQTYSDVTPNPGMIDKMRQWKEQGHYLILQTARHMETCGSNE